MPVSRDEMQRIAMEMDEPAGTDGAVLLLSGYDVLGRVLAQKGGIKYTAAELDSGDLPEGTSVEELTAPIQFAGEGKIASVKNTGRGEATVVVQATSIGIEVGFLCKGVMLYVEDPDTQLKTAYAYLDCHEHPVFIRAQGSAVNSFVTFEIQTIVAGASSVTAVINTAAMVRFDDLDEHNNDPEAHPEAIAAHNADTEAHPPLRARIRGIEVSINGSETLTGHGDPTVETVGKIGQHYINLDTGNEFVCVNDAEEVYTWEKFTEEKSMRKALEDAQTLAASAKAVADGAAAAIAAVQNTISVIPSQAGSLTYNKSAQKPVWNNFSKEMMEVKYGQDKTSEEDFAGETNAGTYKAYFTPKGDYTWGDKSKEEKEVEWTIGRATIATVPSQTDSLTYNTSPQTPTWKDFNEDQLTKDETQQTNAGTYSTSFTPKANYQWPGGETGAKSVQWSIAKAANTLNIEPSLGQSIKVGDKVEIQATTNSDATITAETSNQTYATISVDSAQKKVTVTGAGQGEADITVHSKGSQNYEDASKVLRVSVARKTPTFSIDPSTAQTVMIGSSKKITVTTDSDGQVSAISNQPGIATASAAGNIVTISGATEGGAKITISVPQTVKFNAASAVLDVTVEKPSVAKSSWDDIKAISDAGTAASFFEIGDTKSIILNGTVGTLELKSQAIDVFVLGIDHNAEKEGTHRIHWAIGKINGSMVGLCDKGYNNYYTNGDKYFNMNHWGNYNYGGWQGCDLRYDILGSTNKAPSDYGSSPKTNRVGYDPDNYDIATNPVPNTLMAALPQDLRRVMKTVTKYTDNKGNSSNSAENVTVSVDYLFLLSEFEIHGERQYANQYEQNQQKQYAYFIAGNKKIAYRHDSVSSAVVWWGRSAYYNTNLNFADTYTDGSRRANHANNSWALVAGFTT